MTTFTLAGGCFWCLDAVFRTVRGVEKSVVGYTGGNKSNASYYLVASGTTDHAESVQVTFDDMLLPADVLLDIFFTLHNPTTLNRQGADIGPQYRSAMFYVDNTQKNLFEAARSRAQKIWDEPIVTEITKLDEFYVAEPDQQDYYAQNPASSYCTIVIDPKVSKIREKYAQWVQKESI